MAKFQWNSAKSLITKFWGQKHKTSSQGSFGEAILFNNQAKSEKESDPLSILGSVERGRHIQIGNTDDDHDIF